MSKQPTPAPTASAIGPCPTFIQISRTLRNWKFTQDHRTTRPPTSGDGYDLYSERSFQRKMKFNFLSFLKFSIKYNQFWHKQRIIYDTIHGNDKSVANLISYDTKRRGKYGVHFNNTNSDFALEAPFSIYFIVANRGCLGYLGFNFLSKRSGMHFSYLTLRYGRTHVK